MENSVAFRSGGSREAYGSFGTFGLNGFLGAKEEGSNREIAENKEGDDELKLDGLVVKVENEKRESSKEKGKNKKSEQKGENEVELARSEPDLVDFVKNEADSAKTGGNGICSPHGVFGEEDVKPSIKRKKRRRRLLKVWYSARSGELDARFERGLFADVFPVEKNFFKLFFFVFCFFYVFFF